MIWRVAPTLMLFLSLCAGLASAAIDTYEFEEEALRIRYRALATELRCPKCQNQNIADSNAPVAMDLRAQLYRLLHEGYSDEEIVTFMVARYGEFIRYRPPVNYQTAVLWSAPALFILIGGWLLFRSVRRTSTNKSDVATLNGEESAALAFLVSDDVIGGEDT